MPTQLDTDQVHHLVNGLSLEVGRQADRIRRRSHTNDWPGAASALTELEEAVELLSEFVNVSLKASLTGDPDDEPEPELPAPSHVSTGLYL